MTGTWTFHNPVSMRFGAGCAEAALATIPYRRTLLVTSAGMTRRGTTQRFIDAAQGSIVETYDGVSPNPEMSDLDELALRYRSGGFDAIVALGGGSALDTAKILGVLLGAPAAFTLRSHFLGGRQVPDAPSVPVIAIPTTAGTGSEVTPFATVWDARVGKKYSLAHARMFPVSALLDPRLTKDLPWDVTLATGLDALCQALESIWNRNANPITLGLAMRAARLAWGALQQGESLVALPQARAELMEASLLAGLAISHTRTALCHSMSYPITARFGLPHGLACGFSMPSVLRFNAAAHDDDGRLDQLALMLGYPHTDSLVTGLASLLQKLKVPALLTASFPSMGALTALVPDMYTPGRADNNLRSLGAGDMETILIEAWRDLGLEEKI